MALLQIKLVATLYNSKAYMIALVAIGEICNLYLLPMLEACFDKCPVMLYVETCLSFLILIYSSVNFFHAVDRRAF